ncbi:T9SS type A sorting domain-containing protein [Pontibacter indicus]|uniref:Por secretion system C-terminal sorting domain-containing protein n=1 Tax=Pontibacter indicus TaxID=1317125 RepID=A0A1R3XG99_9BACT|nr:T9SS type A sorting domain-containing protein [Pontibacter indicus]SIT90432.1 Por secretion system C-terminal sorting domain-containing protein [Pontibacter indicus]
MRYLFSILFFLLLVPGVMAQEPLRFSQRADVPVIANGALLQNPWGGGLNTSQFSTIDLNKDGRDDLFVFDRMLRKVYTYLAVQEGGQWRYRYAPEYEVMFPAELENWVLLRDYNCDGLKDIFTSTPLGIRVYRQEATGNKYPTFVLAEDALFYRSRNGVNSINMQMNISDIPAIVDMDGDGDLDILLSEFSGGYTLEYYQNMQVEEGKPCGSLEFALGSDWWGQITECHGCNNFGFGIQCRMAGPLHSGHDGSALLAIDLDGDGDKDLLMGSVECDNLVRMENVGTKAQARMESFEAVFPAGDRAANLKLFPAAYFEDVTFDGIPDLLVAPNSNENIGDLELQRSAWLYRNTGTASKPNFEFAQDNFLQSQMIDLGENAYPAFADIDGDGLLDLLVGNGRANRNGRFVATLSLYRNTGTLAEPAFTFVTDDYLNLSSKEMLSLKPSFFDINQDGVLDLVLTYRTQTGSEHHAGGMTHMEYFVNNAKAGQPYAFNTTRSFHLHTLANGDTPYLFRVDGQRVEMLVGRAGGTLDYYRSAGSGFELVKESIGGIKFDFFRRNLAPVVVDIDGNFKLDLLTVDDSGALRIYNDFLDKLDGDFTETTEVLENELTGEAQTSRFGRGLGLTVAELSGPYQLYLAVGTQGGGLYLLQQTGGHYGNPNDRSGALELKVYPNPVAGKQEPVQVQASEAVSIVLHDMIGRKVYDGAESFNRRHTLDVSSLKAGVYLLRATSRDGRHETRRLVVH